MTCKILVPLLLLPVMLNAQAATPLHTAAKVDVSGTVVDSNAAGVRGAAVVMTNVLTDAVVRVTTGDGGQFTTAAMAGRYEVTIEAAGFKFDPVTIDISPEKPAKLSFKMTGSAPAAAADGIFEWQGLTAESLQKRLDAKAGEGCLLRAVLPISDGKSLFAFDCAGAAKHTVVPLAGAMTATALKSALDSHTGLTLAGGHRLNKTSHLLVFRDAK